MKQGICGISVARVRRSILYQPLAVILAILLSPALSWVENLGGGAGSGGPKPLQASAQVFTGCTAQGNSIIRNYCVNSVSYAVDLQQFEQEMVQAYLAMHGLPAGEAHVIYDYGRQDLRNAVRAQMYTAMVGIVGKNAANRTSHEQSLYTWMQNLIQGYEVGMYQKTLSHFNSFRNDPCHFQIDPDLAAVYKITWDGTSFCFGGLQSGIFQPLVLDAGYFQAYGMKHSYAVKADPGEPGAQPDYAAIFADTSISVSEIAGVAAGVSVSAGAAVGIGVASSFAAASAAYTAGLAAVPAVSAGGAAASGYVVSGASVAGLSTGAAGAAVAGIVLIVVIAVAAAVVGAYELYNNEKQQNDIFAFTAKLGAAQATLPDLATILNDTTGDGSFKVQNALYSQTVGDVPSSAALPGHQAGDMSFVITSKRTGQTQYSGTLTYLDWQKNVWTAETSGGWLRGTCATGPNSTRACAQTDSIGASLRYTDWTGQFWTAARSGFRFVSGKTSLVTGDLYCTMDPVSGVTKATDPTKCLSYVSTSLPMMDRNGNEITVSLSEFGPPLFLDPGPLSFGVGVPATKLIATSNNPPSQVCLVSGNFPHFPVPISLCGSNSSYPLSYDGALNATPGSYTLQLAATNSIGTTTRSFTVSLDNNLGIVNNLDCTTFTTGCYVPAKYGQPFRYKVVAVGNPTPKLSLDPTGNDFTGMTFVDNGDGTGVLSGTALGSPAGSACGTGLTVACGGFVASNATQGSVTLRFQLVIAPALKAQFDGPTSFDFTEGIPKTVQLRAYNYNTRVHWTSGAKPSWITVQDNGDSTATLSGTPPAGTAADDIVQLLLTAEGALQTFQQVRIKVLNTPTLSSASQATFQARVAGSFSATANNGSITTLDRLPAGLTFNAGNPGILSGTPALGTGGAYPLQLTATAGSQSSIQNFALTVNEAPSITSPKLVVLIAGRPASFDVTTFGYPRLATKTALPSPSFVGDPALGMQFSTIGLPLSLDASNLNSAGKNTGTLRIFGTPGAADVGTSKVLISAYNTIGVGPGTQLLTLQIVPYSPISAVSLLSNWVLSRDIPNQVSATVVIVNNGTQAAQNVSITGARIGTASGAIFPGQLPSIAAGSTGMFRIVFPAGTVGATGTGSVFNLTGSYTGGTFTNSGRIVLP